MPIHACTLPNGKPGFQWGGSGKCYAERADAERQAAAIHASGWTGKARLGLLLKGDFDGHPFRGNQYAEGEAAQEANAIAWQHGSDVVFSEFDDTKIGSRTDPGFYGQGH